MSSFLAIESLKDNFKNITIIEPSNMLKSVSIFDRFLVTLEKILTVHNQESENFYGTIWEISSIFQVFFISYNIRRFRIIGVKHN